MTGQDADSLLSPEFHKTQDPSSAIFYICYLPIDISKQPPSAGKDISKFHFQDYFQINDLLSQTQLAFFSKMQ